jgi:protein tyrosine/serine phosphatase
VNTLLPRIWVQSLLKARGNVHNLYYYYFRVRVKMVTWTPPEAFGIVEEGVYRSNEMEATNFPFLSTLKLKNILLLSPEGPNREVLAFLKSENINLVHVGHSTLLKSNIAAWRPISEELIKEGVEFTLDRDNYPLMIMCTTGVHETGTLIGCLRKLMRWNLNSIVVEYRAYAGNRSRYINEQFVELFDLDLITLPPSKQLPSWLPNFPSTLLASP